jgi:Phosphotransferase enzyme family
VSEPYASIVTAAERVISHSLGRELRLADVTCLSEDDRRNLLLRARDLSGGPPGSFIIKKVVADSYDRADAASFDTTRFFSDWGGAEFLSAVLPSPRTPRFYGGDADAGFFVLEDLGDHRSLVEPLLEGDAARAESALLSLSACLGSVHAGTVGQSAAFQEIMRRLNPHAGTSTPALSGFAERVQQLTVDLDRLHVRVDAGFHTELEAVISAIARPGPFLSYVHGDPCPDNIFWDGGELRLIDFEFGGLGHALADAAYGRMLFPSCWCANRVPRDVVSRMERAYRAELVNGCREAEDDALFESALTDVCGFWLLSTLGRHVANAIEADRTWGIATMRQRVLARLEAFVATADEFDRRPALRGVAARLLESLRKIWLDVAPLPLYPAFGDSSRP